MGEGEEHRWSRGIVAGEFVGKKLESWLPVIEETAAEMIERFSAEAAEGLAAGFAKSGEIDLVAQFSRRFPIRVIAGMLGLPRGDYDYFESIYNTLFAGMGYGRAYFRAGEKAKFEIHDYLTPIIAERRANPTSDLISKFVTAEMSGEMMSDDQIKAFITLLLVGGGDTTHKAIDAMWWNLLHNYEQYEAVRDDPELMDRVFTEMLRFDGSNHYQGRRAIHETELGGRVIPWVRASPSAWAPGTATSASSRTRIRSTSSVRTSTSGRSCGSGTGRTASPATSASGRNGTSAWATRWPAKRR